MAYVDSAISIVRCKQCSWQGEVRQTKPVGQPGVFQHRACPSCNCNLIIEGWDSLTAIDANAEVVDNKEPDCGLILV